uniref:Uncharacterized protein n=1 Tax=Oryza punctata TaxID=4537 RepID=A0A0E0MEP5_ORYPU
MAVSRDGKPSPRKGRRCTEVAKRARPTGKIYEVRNFGIDLGKRNSTNLDFRRWGNARLYAKAYKNH